MDKYPEGTGHIKGSDTSYQAAVRFEASGARITQERMIFDFIAAAPCTAMDVEKYLNAQGVVPRSITARIAGLMNRGIVRDTGTRKEQDGYNRRVIETVGEYRAGSAKDTRPGITAFRNAVALAYFKLQTGLTYEAGEILKQIMDKDKTDAKSTPAG